MLVLGGYIYICSKVRISRPILKVIEAFNILVMKLESNHSMFSQKKKKPHSMKDVKEK